MDTDLKPGDRPALVKELRALSEEERMGGRAVQLTALADALDTGEKLEAWAEIDLGTAFPASESIGPAPSDGAVQRLVETGPTALVFLPVLITWAGLALAAGAHGRSQGDPSLEGLSFLERWQASFNGELPAWLAFDQVAVYTLTGIILLIGAVVAQSLYRRRTEERDRAERDGLARRLVCAMTAAQLELGSVRLGSPARFAGELGKSVQHLRELGQVALQAQQDVRHTLGEAQESLRMAHSAAGALREGSDGVSGAVRDGLEVLQDLYVRFGEVSGALDRVAAASEELSATAERERSRTREELGRLTTDLAEKADRTVTDGLERVNGAVTASTEEIGRRLSEGEAAVRSALGEWQETGSGFAHRAELAADLSGRVAEALSGLPEAVNRLREGIDDLQSAMADETARRAGTGPDDHDEDLVAP